MKQKMSLLLVIGCLFLFFSGCGAKENGNNSDSSTSQASSGNASTTNSSIDTSDVQDTDSNKTEAGPITQYNITLSSVVIDDGDMEAMSPGDDLASLAYCSRGVIAFPPDEEDPEAQGFAGSLWCYLIPTDATITFHVTSENGSYWLEGYDLEEEEGNWTDHWNAYYLGTYENNELSSGDYIVTREEIQKLMPSADLILCGIEDNYVEVVFDDGSIIKPFVPSETPNTSQDSGLNLTLGSEVTYTGGEGKTESVKIALGNDPNGNRNYMSAEIYHLPANATITLPILAGKNYCSLSGYTVEKTADGRWDTTPCGGYFYRDGLEAGNYTLTLEEIQKDIPEFDLLICDNGDKFFFVVFD